MKERERERRGQIDNQTGRQKRMKGTENEEGEEERGRKRI